ncbi:SHI RELATED SEQUENCE 1 protein [Spatholobus suberectus]|nr:SHI RELATED SEQUENCE 1 protein [Spatholobus suberectus]
MSTMQGQEAIVKGSKCQDCGNQAKKDCAYARCRTCCKNNGFKCQTHVRSTWIPVDRRRQKVEQPPPTTNLQGDIPKRHKQNPYSSLEEFKFPAVMSSMALFSCVQVRSMDDTVNEIAYQTSVNIGGHVFSGLLYDQGPEQSFNARGDNSSIGPLEQQHNLNLSSASIHTREGASATVPPLSATAQELFFPPPPHPFPLASFRPDMAYLSHPKP